MKRELMYDGTALILKSEIELGQPVTGYYMGIRINGFIWDIRKSTVNGSSDYITVRSFDCQRMWSFFEDEIIGDNVRRSFNALYIKP